MKAVKAASVRGKVKAPAGKVLKQVVVERGTKGGGEASAEEAPAPTEEEIAIFALEARAAAQSAGRPLVVPLPTPNRDLIAPEDVALAIFLASGKADLVTLTPLCEQWAGNVIINWHNRQFLGGFNILGNAAMVGGYPRPAECLSLLLSAGAKIDNVDLSNERSALIWAAMNGRVDTCRILIDEGANIHLKGNDGRDALFYASSSSSSTNSALICRMLLERGAKIKAKGTDGYTSLMSACESRNEETCRVLLEACAIVNERNRKGQTATFFAKKHKCKEIAALLKAAGGTL